MIGFGLITIPGTKHRAPTYNFWTMF